jgi:hypothetical protein
MAATWGTLGAGGGLCRAATRRPGERARGKTRRGCRSSLGAGESRGRGEKEGEVGDGADAWVQIARGRKGNRASAGRGNERRQVGPVRQTKKREGARGRWGETGRGLAHAGEREEERELGLGGFGPGKKKRERGERGPRLGQGEGLGCLLLLFSLSFSFSILH